MHSLDKLYWYVVFGQTLLVCGLRTSPVGMWSLDKPWEVACGQAMVCGLWTSHCTGSLWTSCSIQSLDKLWYAFFGQIVVYGPWKSHGMWSVNKLWYMACIPAVLLVFGLETNLATPAGWDVSSLQVTTLAILFISIY